MTLEIINKNLKRLCDFYNHETITVSSEIPDSKFLLDSYGRILDFFGAPFSGLSLLFLPHKEYCELEQWISKQPFVSVVSIQEAKTVNGIPIIREPYLHFVYNNYDFFVKKEKVC